MSEKFDFMSLEEEPVEVIEEPTVEVDVEVEVDEDVEDLIDIEEDVEEPQVKEPYSAEQIQEILTSDGELDTTRLSAEGQATMKAMQRAFTPKLQEAAELRKEMQTLREQVEQAKPKAEPNDIYEAYDANPEVILKAVDDQIMELADDPKNLREIKQLEALKFEFQRRDMARYQTEQTSKVKASEYVNKLIGSIPNFAEKQGELRKFALETLGYTESELAAETDISRAGEQAVRTVMRINAAYDKLNARKTVVKKKAVKAPSKVEKPSAGFSQSGDTTLADIKSEALRSRNFKDYFAALEEEE